MNVVSFARSPRTALHQEFEWDNDKAANGYRLEQARRIIRFTVHTVKENVPPVRVYVSLTSDRQEGDSYRSLVEVMADTELREQLLAQALREAESWRARYERLVELTPILQAIVEVQKENGVSKMRRDARKRLTE